MDTLLLAEPFTETPMIRSIMKAHAPRRFAAAIALMDQKNSASLLTLMVLVGLPVSWGEEVPVPRQTPNPASFADMHLGLFAHYTYVGKPYQWGVDRVGRWHHGEEPR